MSEPNVVSTPTLTAPIQPSSRGTAVIPKKNKYLQSAAAAPAAKKLTFEDGLHCVDYLPGFNMLAIGYTKVVRMVEVVQTTRPPLSFALRSCGMFGNVAKVETLAWYPSSTEAVLAMVQLSRNITILFDTLVEKGGKYMTQQWTHNARGRCLSSSISVGSGSLNTAIVGAPSMPSTPFYTNTSMSTNTTNTNTTEFVQRAVGPCSMVEVVIDTGHLRVERIAWDPHNPYTLAITSNATHFELWTIPVIDNKVYAPQLRLRPPSHGERSITRSIAFSPSDPNLIIVAVEMANAGKLFVYDRRHVEAPRSLGMTGPCLTVAFHPTFCDLLAVCYRKAKTKTYSRVQFFRVLGEVSLGTQKESVSINNNNNSGSSSGNNNTLLASCDALPVVEQEIVPPVDSVDSLNRLRWRPCGSTQTTVAVKTTGESSVDTSGIKIDAISSQLWFATSALNGQEISVWDAVNGFTPMFSIKRVYNARKQDQREHTLQEPTDCVWVNSLTLVSVFKDGDILLTSLMDESTTSKDTLFRRPVSNITNHDNNNNNNNNNSNNKISIKSNVKTDESDVFGLGAILPTAAVVADLFGRSFVIRNTTSLLREYYTKIITAEKQEMLEQMAINENSSSSPINVMTSSLCSRNQRESLHTTPMEGGIGNKGYSPPVQFTLSQTSLQSTPFNKPTQSPSSVMSASAVAVPAATTSDNTNGSKRFEFLFPLLFSLASPLLPTTTTTTTTTTTGMVSEELARNEGCVSKNMERVGPQQQQQQQNERSVPASSAVAIEQHPRGFRGSSDVQSESSLEEKSWKPQLRRSEAVPITTTTTTTTTTTGTLSVRGNSVPVDNNFTERNELLRLVSPQSDSRTINSPISLTPSDDVLRQRAPYTTLTGRKDPSISSSLHDLQLKNGTSTLTKDTAAKASLLLGSKSRVNPEIERFVLSDEVCGWAYVERSSEHETFARYAMGWEVGYEVARHLRANSHTSMNSPMEEITLREAHKIDRYFVKIMLHNAKVCEEREREIQRERSINSINETRNTCGGKRGCYNGNEMGSVDPRGHLWSATAEALQSHNVGLVTSLVRSQLDYTSLVGDVQYSAVLFLLFCLWWKQRHVCMHCYPCPLLSLSKNLTNSSGNTSTSISCSCNNNNNYNDDNYYYYNNNEDNKKVEKGSGKAAECTPQQWRFRARQWLEQYVSRLYVRKLYVPLNELLLIVPDVMGESNPGLPRADDIAQKLFTCIYCGTCQKKELVPRTGKGKQSMVSHYLSSMVLDKVEDEDEDVQRSVDDDSSSSSAGDSFSSSSSSSSSSSVSSRDGGSIAVSPPIDGTVIDREEREKSIAVIVEAPPRNAYCSRCYSGSLMTCVICEEVVEGMYLWLRSCGHGGHVHHIKEWLQVSNECPCCGIPILFSDETSKYA
ncbi:uncharacterized protein TM35_000141930 [Trypanosoma theileri]|uniref:RING-type domain-containing protein n=1 Tax=Trypanosoma theileri TaxID=67003 RepID=A0A1X0NWC6_9TRYP|nr:uncharacterized protein TM35_000141930 [Trypanosoma theileri]ORC88982.1 hypothetical protein TM35_000141930 [Trypanosoma theileri]